MIFRGGGVQNLVHLYWTLLVFELPFWTSESFFVSHSSIFTKTVLSPSVTLRHIQFVVILMSSEGKLSTLVWYYCQYIIIRCHNELFKYTYRCFSGVLFIVCCYFCLCILLCLLLTIWLLSQSLNEQESNWIIINVIGIGLFSPRCVIQKLFAAIFCHFFIFQLKFWSLQNSFKQRTYGSAEIFSAVCRLSDTQQGTRSLEIHCDMYWQTCLQGITLLLSVRDKTMPLSTRQLISLWRHISEWRHYVCRFTDFGCKWDRQMRCTFRQINKQTLGTQKNNSVIICQLCEAEQK